MMEISIMMSKFSSFYFEFILPTFEEIGVLLPEIDSLFVSSSVLIIDLKLFL